MPRGRKPKITDRDVKVYDNLVQHGPVEDGLDELADRLASPPPLGTGEDWTYHDAWLGLQGAKELSGQGTVVVRKHGPVGGCTIEVVDGRDGAVPALEYHHRVGRENKRRLRTQEATTGQAVDQLRRAGYSDVVVRALQSSSLQARAASEAIQSSLDVAAISRAEVEVQNAAV